MLDTHKPHISNLPIVDYGDIKNGKNKSLAISIPIFYSGIDSNQKDFDLERFKNIHAKSAAWVALSFIYNTDYMITVSQFIFMLKTKYLMRFQMFLVNLTFPQR